MKKQNLSAEEQMRRLGNRWVFDCANRLMADEGMERKAAFRQAVRAYHLLELLGKGEAEFEYLKVNGEKRHARGTLCVAASVPSSTTTSLKTTSPMWDKRTSASSPTSTSTRMNSVVCISATY